MTAEPAAVSAPLEIYFIRHGETAWTISGQHTGRSELPLTAGGEAQARALATTLSGLPFAQVLSSPRQRARRTCELAGLGAQAQTDTELAEWDYGDYEGLRSAEICQQRPGWDVWQHGCPGGEMPADVAARADRLITRLCRQHGRIALFSHGQFARVMAARWIGLPMIAGRHLAIDPASISRFGFETGHPQRRVIALWNATADGALRRAT